MSELPCTNCPRCGLPTAAATPAAKETLRPGELLIAACGMAVLLSVGGYVFHGRLGVEKVLTALVMPLGLSWLLLSGWVVVNAARRRWAAVVLAAGLWLAFTLCGSPLLSDIGFAYLESRETTFRPGSDAPLDVLVVLGGGTRQGPERAEAAESGDRVLYAAQLYLQGKTQRLITTGSPVDGMRGKHSSPSEQTREIWMALGIPAAAIDSLPGKNTYQEIQSLRAAFPQQSGERIGLLTSAWHLPRAMRLARRENLSQLIPVAADHLRPSESRTYLDYLPSAGGFRRLAQCQHEFMAWWVRR